LILRRCNVKTKWNLTKSEQRAHSANSERLESAGVATGVENTTSSEPPLLRVEQSENSLILAGAHKGIALAFCARLIALKSGITLLDDCGITIPGCDDANFFWVPPRGGSLGYNVFGWLNLARGEALNDLLFSGCPLPCGKIFDGIFVAWSFDSLPSQFQTGMNIDGEVCLVDQLGNPYKWGVELSVERYAQGGEHAKKGDGLYAPKRVFGTRLQRQVRAHPTSALGKLSAPWRRARVTESSHADSTGRR
jgi:hypothetical protein